MGTHKANFQRHLKRQLSFLQRSCESYDQGYTDEAIRIATILRVLFHQTKSSTSLMTHLNIKDIELLSTVSDIQKDKTFDSLSVFYGMGLFKFNSSSETRMVPSLEMSFIRHFINFTKWWEQIVFILPPDTLILTRKKIILDATNKDGGAHVDETLTKEYAALAADGALDQFLFLQHGESIKEAHYVAIRQMAYEILNSPELIRLSDNV